MATIVSSELCTPARVESTSNDPNSSLHASNMSATMAATMSSNTVTPSEPKEDLEEEHNTRATDHNENAHDGNETDPGSPGSTTTSSSKKDSATKRGLVSRRGRGLGNPGQRTSSRSSSAERSDQLQMLAQAIQPHLFETPLLQRNSVTFSPHGDDDDDDDLELADESSDLPHGFSKIDDKILSPNPEAFPGMTTPCRYKDDEKKNDYKASPPPQRERDFFATTPTDFALDYGKHYPTSFDTSNVLAWLNSPNPNPFSPGGGFTSLLNSPRFAPRTPRTPTVSTSFFFSDVASLPKNSARSTGTKDNNGRETIICISPLASKTNATAMPLNLKDVFNSPPRPFDGRFPTLSDTPLPKPSIGGISDNDKSLKSGDAIHQVERDIMEDEDLSVLLQLAGNAAAAAASTAKPSSSPTPVRSLGGESVFRSQEKATDLPGLHLPMNLNGKTEDGVEAPPKILRKKSSSLEESNSGLTPPALGMRSHSSGGHPHEFLMNMGATADVSTKTENVSKDHETPTGTKATCDSDSKKDKSNSMAKMESLTAAASASDQYPLSLNMNAQDLAHYYNMAASNGVQPHSALSSVNVPPGTVAGSLRVVVGGPLPPNCPPDAAGSMMRNDGAMANGTPLYHGEYTNGLPTSSYSQPGVPGMYPHSQYGPPHLGYGYQYPGSSPSGAPHARSPMSLFGSPREQDAGKKGQKAKNPKGPKRALAPDEAGELSGNGEKKAKKPRADGTVKKKKNRSPQVADKQKCAEKILAVNAASGGKHDKEAEMAAAIMRGVTMRPSGKWQAQLYFAGKSRYIGVFDSREKAALAYEIAREKLKTGPRDDTNPKSTENLVNIARKAAFDGVNEQLPSGERATMG